MRLVELAATTLVTIALAAPIDTGIGSSLARRNFFGDLWNGATTVRECCARGSVCWMNEQLIRNDLEVSGLNKGGGSSSSKETSSNQAVTQRMCRTSLERIVIES